MTPLCESLLAHAASDDAGALPPALAAHVATCAGCQRLMAQLTAAAGAAAAAPAVAVDDGFVARSERGAQRVLARRRRARIAWATSGGAALAALGVWAAMASRAPDAPPAARSLAAASTTADPAPPVAPPVTTDDLPAALVNLARAAHAAPHPRADRRWQAASRSLAAYQSLLADQGATP